MSNLGNQSDSGSADLSRSPVPSRVDIADPDGRRKPPRASRGNVHVITIRNVPPDRRPWAAWIPASICALIALGVLSAFQHSPTWFSKASVHPVITPRAETQSSDARMGFKTVSPAESTGQASSLELTRSVRSKPRNPGSRGVAGDTFVDYRHPSSGQNGTDSGQPVTKRVVVYN